MTDETIETGVSRRRYLRAAGVLGVGGTVALAGCSGDGGDGGDDGGGNDGGDGTDGDDGGGDGGTPAPTELSVTAVWTDAEAETFKQVLSHAQSNANVETEYHPRTTDGLKSGTLMDYQSGVAPADIVVMPFPSRIASDGEKGHLSPMGDVWDESNFVVSPSSVSAGGTTYAAPFKMDLKPGFWYRKSFFDEHGLSAPESYDEFTTLLEDLKGISGVDAPIASGNGTGWPLSDLTEAFFLRQDDGAQLQQDLISGDADFTDDRVVTALEEIKALHDSGYFSQTRDFAVQYEYFWQNSTPLYFQGSFTPSFDAIKDPSDLGVFRLPGTSGMVGSVNWLTVPKYADNVDAAKSAVEAIISPEGQQIWAEAGGFISSNGNVSADAYKIAVMSRLSTLAGEVTIVPDLDDSLGSPFQDEFWAQLKGMWAEPGNTNVQELASTLEEAQNGSLEG